MELNKRFTLTSPKGTISNAGIDGITLFISNQRLMQGAWKEMNPETELVFLPPLPNEWEWVWTIQRGKYAGTLPKRVSSYYHKVHKLKCPPDFLREIGNLAKQHTEDNATYTFEVVDKFDWNAGDFGDRGSCFWGGRERAREIMQENGGLAVCFYDSEGKGIARAWFQSIGENLYVVWNGYGFPGNPTLTIARVIALHLNASYKRIQLTNSSSDSGVLYINSGRGFMIGASEVLEQYIQYDFEWDTADDTCEDCGRDLYEDDVYVTPDGQHLCESCYHELYENCERCGEDYPRESVHYIESVRQYVCEHCVEYDFSYCESCDREYLSEDMQEHDNRWYCSRCFEELEVEPPEESE